MSAAARLKNLTPLPLPDAVNRDHTTARHTCQALSAICGGSGCENNSFYLKKTLDNCYSDVYNKVSPLRRDMAAAK